MVLNQVLSHDDKYIITSERDEKIRVSCNPNAYNIHSYCLGHTEFVTSLNFIHNNLLLSGSGVSRTNYVVTLFKRTDYIASFTLGWNSQGVGL